MYLCLKITFLNLWQIIHKHLQAESYLMINKPNKQLNNYREGSIN